MTKLVIALSILISTISSAREATFKWAILEVLTHQITIAKEFAKEMKPYGINVEVKLFSEEEGDKYKKSTSLNDFQITQNLSAVFFDREPRLKVWEAPFLFRSSTHIENFIKSNTAKDILSGLDTDKELALTFTFAGGFMYMLTPMKLNSFSQLSGLECIFDDQNVFFNNFMSPLKIKNKKGHISDFTKTSEYCVEELGSDIQVNMVKHNNYFTLTGHRVLARVLRVSKEALNLLNKKQRQAFLSNLKRLTDKERALVYQETVTAIQTLKQRGIKTYQWTDADKDRELKKYLKGINSLNKEIGSTIRAVKLLR